MKLYDFSAYAKKRDAQRAAENIEALKDRLNEPGVVVELKQQVDDYLSIHKDALKKAAS